MLKPLVLLVVISLAIHNHHVLGQWGSNRGPIYFTYPNPYCQRNVIPHYPVREDWIMGKWKLLYEYQESGGYKTKCKTMDFKKPFSSMLSYNYETTIRRITTSEIYKDDNHKDTNIIIAQHGGPAIEARYILDKTDGLFTMGAGQKTHASALVFIGFTSKVSEDKTAPKMEPYDTALYAVCSHSATLANYGGSFISEIGIMSKSGNASDESLEHYKKLLDDDEVIDTALLQPVLHDCP